MAKNAHPRSKHQQRYDFNKLIEGTPELKTFLKLSPSGEQTINFHNPNAVKLLNEALLKRYYQIENWEIPPGYLCPPIPGRADYIHHLADLLAKENNGKIPKGNNIKCLDIGVGANCIYPIIGNRAYGWSFIGSDIDPIAVESAKKIVEENSILKGKIEIRLQENPKSFFSGALKTDERVDLTVCNPPFHASEAEARNGTKRKLKNLKSSKTQKIELNFGGQSNELWTEGGERNFVQNMISESINFATNCLWFSTLISKETNIKPLQATLKKANVADMKIIVMKRGNKSSRIIAWTFLTYEQRLLWGKLRFK